MGHDIPGSHPSQECRWPSLRTSRLHLRPFTELDLAPFAELNADPRVMRFLGEPLTPEQSDAVVSRVRDQWKERGLGAWAVDRTDVQRPCFIGCVGLMVPNFEAEFTPGVEVAWRLSASHWGQGFATEAAHAAVDFGFDQLALDEVFSFTTRANAVSRRVMEKLGMLRDLSGDFEHPSLPPGHPLRPHVLYRLRRAPTP